MSVIKGKSGGVDVGSTGGTVNVGKEMTVKGGESYKGNAQKVTAGYKDGHFVGELKKTTSSGNEHLSKEKERTYGLEEGRLTVGSGNTTEYKRKEKVDGEEVERKRTIANSTKFGIGSGGLAASHTHSRTSEDGTKRSLTGGLTSDGKGNSSLSGGYSRTDKNGNTFSAGAKIGTAVECSEPKEVGGKWVVTYKRSKSIGGNVGGSHKGMGAQAGVSTESYDTGTRSFKTKAEAEDFKKNAAFRIQAEAPDPNTLAGAMSMEIGESLGQGDATTGTLGGSVAVQGATLSLTGTKKSTDDTTVRRVSANIFEVTRSMGNQSGKDLGLSGNGIALNRGGSDSSGSMVTYRFDLATPDGQAAYQVFCKTGMPPMTGGRLVAHGDSKGEESHEGVSVFGLLDDVYQRRSWESEVHDADGKHEEYGGARSHNISTGRIGHFLGDKNINESVQLISRQENDKTAGFTIEGQYGGESGKNNRKNMARLSGDHSDTGATSDKSSGQWTVSTDVDAEVADKALAKIPSLEKIHGIDAKMRAMSEYVKKNGEGTAGAIEGFGDTMHAWDVQLQGDKNFPGKAGRLEIEAKTKAYAELMKISMASPQLVVGQLQREIGDLEERKKAVTDPKKYPDLPDKLRMQQLSLIDEQIAQLQAIRHPGLVEMSKNTIGEDMNAILTRQHDEHGYDNIPPGPQRELAKLRDEIAGIDGMLASAEKDNMEARRALAYAVGHYTDEDLSRKAGPENRAEVKDKLDHGRLIDDIHRRKSIGEIDDMRSEFLLSQAEPQKALMYGRALRDKLRAEQTATQEAGGKLRDSARVQANLNTIAAKRGKWASFWADVDDDNKESGYEIPEYVNPHARPRTSMTLPD